MKRRMLAFLLLLLFALTASAGAVSLYVDTDLIQTDVPPTIVDGRTLVPMRAIFEALGAEVDWDGETRTATGTLGDHTVSIQVCLLYTSEHTHVPSLSQLEYYCFLSYLIFP